MSAAKTLARLFTATFLIAALHPLSTLSQIKPDASTAVPAKTGTVSVNTPTTPYTGNMPLNYVRTWEPQQPYTSETDVISASRQVEEVVRSTQYIDGLGRPLQTVGWQSSPSKKDIVASVIYDGFGREQYKYLPYTATTDNGVFKADPFTDQQSFYSSVYPSEQPAFSGEQFYYSHTVFEASPLNRPLKTFAPGNSWAGSEVAGSAGRSSSEKAVSVQYLVNNLNDIVRIWDIGFDATVSDATNIPTSIPVSVTEDRVYGTGQLYKTVTLDEHGTAVVEYKDKEDHIVLKKVQIGTVATDYSGYTGFLSTFYIYDDLGQLRFVIPPKAVGQAMTNSWTLTQTVINELCFRYEYDSRGRIRAKKVPGADWVYMVYDSRDRLVFTQDGNMRTKSPAQWTYTLYDELNRPVETGIIGYSGSWDNLVSSASAASGTSSSAGSGSYNNGTAADLLFSSREYGRTAYQATTSLTLSDGFESEGGAEFAAEIITGSSSGTFSTSSLISMNSIPSSGVIRYPLTYSYYDDYSFTSVKSYSTADNSKLSGGSNPTATIVSLPSSASTATKSLPTGSRVRVLEDPDDLTQGKWLETVTFYDDKGRPIQAQSDNYEGGTDIATSLYSFTGKVLCSYLVHSNPAGARSSATALKVKTTMVYDHMGRLLTIEKQLNDDVSTKRTIETNSYDALGRLKKKEIGQKSGVDASPLERDAYTYNIRGWLKGVNWYGSSSYASQQNSTSDKWFSFDLSYDWGMSSGTTPTQTPQYNGNIGGMRWQSAGDGVERAYGFGYDMANRLLKGNFTQKGGSGWATDPNIDFSMKMGDGTTASSAYDENGNILRMQQWGLKVNQSIQIDDLRYTYENSGVSNRLKNVIDFNDDMNTTLGDFRTLASHPQKADKAAYVGDGSVSPNTITDYRYDNNGNLRKDLNKAIGTAAADGIVYNHLNLPYKITVKNSDGSLKGTITYIYDAAGNKLEKRTVEAPSSFNGNISKETQTAYLGSFVYENNTLQFLGQEDGRIRPVQKVDPSTGQPVTGFAYDYFLKDHLGNVRMVLTDEQKQDIYPAATLEDGKLATEKAYYDIQDAQIALKSSLGSPSSLGNYTNNNGIANPPANSSFDNTNSTKLYKLNKNTQKVGLGIALKVMAGDKIDVWGKSYYESANSGGTSVNASLVASDIIGALLGSASGAATGHGTATEILNNTSGTVTPLNGWLSNDHTLSSSTKPRAYLNYVFLDEQFKYVSGGASAVDDAAYTLKDHHNDLQNIAVPKNGYAYIYASNESPVDVFFDNVQVVHTRGPLTEETHYYPFGLIMKGISSKAAGSLDNKYKFNKGSELQNKEFSDGSGLEWYATNFRSLDPQLGRWWQADPKPDHSQSLYSAMNNNPMRFADPLGDTAIIFGKDGQFLRFQDDGKKYFSGKMITGTKSKTTVDANGNATITTKVKYSKFSLNDGRLIAQAVKNGVINRVEMVSNSKIEQQIDRSGAKTATARNSPMSYAMNSEAGGKMDYGIQGAAAGDLNKNTLYVTGGVGYDIGDFGNFLWGRGMAELGISLPTAQAGAQYNHIFNGRRGNDMTSLYDLGPNTYGNPGWFDAVADQQAITNGYLSSPTSIKEQQKLIENLSNALQYLYPYQK